ncbi:hypothetical protein GCM10028824_44420 [Hymenobacter segetis]|uniref:Cardiolipin synthase N-terminal domain-containing protein n=1 Tax=Hymenobacter segetis TaxID=2025509 RepID=A0ABU9M019_9BACT
MPLLLDQLDSIGLLGALVIGIPCALGYLIVFIVVAVRAKGEKRMAILIIMALLALLLFPYIFSPLKML